MRERLLDGFKLASSSEAEIKLINKAGYELSVTAVDPQRLVSRVRVTGKDRALPINSFFKHYHDGSERVDDKPQNSSSNTATIHCGGTTATLDWSSATACPLLTITDDETGSTLR